MESSKERQAHPLPVSERPALSPISPPLLSDLRPPWVRHSLFQTSPRVSASLSISTNATPDAVVLMEEGARTMLRISREVGSDGLGNFRFCVAFCCRPGIPFFPAAYHDRGSEGQAAGEVRETKLDHPD